MMFHTVRDTWRKNGPEAISACTGGLPAFVVRASPKRAAGVPVFCYHDIGRSEFESHLRFLRANNYDTLTADDFLTAIKDNGDSTVGSSQVGPRIVITFDDGLLSLFTTVFPLVREYNVRIVAF